MLCGLLWIDTSTEDTLQDALNATMLARDGTFQEGGIGMTLVFDTRGNKIPERYSGKYKAKERAKLIQNKVEQG